MGGRVIKTLFTLVVGWILFSMTGTISMKFSCPLPQYLLTHNSHMRYTGATDENLLEKNMKEPYVEPGTFDELNLFRNGNLINGIYYDVNDDTYRFGTAEGARWLNGTTQDDGLLVADDTAVGIDSGYYWFYMGEKRPFLGSKRDSLLYAGNWYEPFMEDGALSEDKIAQMLEKQTEEKLTLVEMVGLMFLHYSEPHMLLGWYPEEHIAVLRPDTSRYVVYRTDTMEKEQYFIPEFSYVHSISSEELLAYDEISHSVIRYELATGATETVAGNFDDIIALNYTRSDGQMILGGLESEHKAFLYYTKTGELVEHELGDDFFAEGFAFGEENFLILDRFEKEGARYKRGPY